MLTVASFTPRTSAPAYSNSYYYSGNPFYQAGYGMPNCTCYAFGRFWEICGKYPSLSTSNARDWYGKTSDGYSRGKTPKLGAVICWHDNYRGAGGHVAIVEKIYSDGSIETSNSAWSGTNFYMQTLSPPDYTWNSYYYQFQGFIYNPGVSGGSTSEAVAFSKFISTALSKVGQTNTWVCSKVGIARSQPWCGAFIAACAKEAGIMGKVVSSSWTTSGQLSGDGVTYKGQYFKGPYQGVVTKPQVGDICGTMNSGGSVVGTYGCSHVGIVTKVLSDSFEFTSGNSTNGSNETTLVTTRTYKFTDTSVFGYYRPKWSEVGGTTDNISDTGLLSIGGAPLYEFENTKDDATVREVCYMSNAEPSIKVSDMKLSVVNYTRILGPLSEVLGVASSGSSAAWDGGEVDFSGIGNANAAKIGNCLISAGFTPAQAVGMLANIQQESGYDPGAVGDGGTSFGLCQWHAGRGTNMKNYVGSGWATNIEKQVEFLVKELKESYKSSTYDPIVAITTNDAESAAKVAKIWCINYEVPADRYTRAEERASIARSLWSKIKITTTYSEGSGGTSIAGAVIDNNYVGRKVSITAYERSILENIVYGEFGADATGAKLIAQCMRDAIVSGYAKAATMPSDMRYTGYSAGRTTVNQISRDAVKYIFDEGKYAVKHRILVMYARDMMYSAWHESQHFIVQYQNVRFFDYWN